MRTVSRLWRRAAAGLVIALLAVVALAAIAHSWVIPALIVAQIRKSYDGHVSIRGWWIGVSSSGVTGLVLREGESARSPAWAVAARATTDLTVGKLLHGRFRPDRIALTRPRFVYRIDREGNALTRMPFKDSDTTTPEVSARGARLTFRQQGRPEMTVTGIDGRLAGDAPGRGHFEARAEDAKWGRVAVVGRYRRNFKSLWLRLTTAGLVADLDKAARIPWVAPKVWNEVRPRGPVGVEVLFWREVGSRRPIEVRTAVAFEGTTLRLPRLELVGRDVTGRMTVQDHVVRLEDVRGRLVGGRVTVGGWMEFVRKPDRFDLPMVLEGVEVEALPRSWGLDRVGLAGHLSGTARLLVALREEGTDLTGSSGQGVITRASVKGLPLERLRLALRAPGIRPATPPGALPPSGRAFAPQMIAADFEVPDVSLDRSLARFRNGETLRVVSVSGRLRLSARAQIPLGALDVAGAYAARGEAELSGATIGGLGIDDVRARGEVGGGVLEVTEFRGRLAGAGGASPLGGGSLPPGGFRGGLRADLEDGGPVALRFEGAALPLEELTAPFLTRRPEGLVSVRARGTADPAALGDPESWTLSGRAEAPRVTYRGATFGAIEAPFTLERGQLVVPDLTARYGRRPLRGRGTMGVARPFPFDAALEVAGWPLAEVLALAGASGEAQSVSGTVTAAGTARGTIAPGYVEARGGGRIGAVQYGPVQLGDVPIRWLSDGEDVLLTADDVRRYGGRIVAEARVPVRGDRPIAGTVVLSRVETATLVTEVAGRDLDVRGRADGRGRFVYRPGASGDLPPLEAAARLEAPDLHVEGVPVRALEAVLAVHHGRVRYDLAADGLGGSIRVRGGGRLTAEAEDSETEAQVRAVGLRLADLWTVVAGEPSSATLLKGEGAVIANLRSHPERSDLRARGRAEVRGLGWGRAEDLGGLRAEFSIIPDGWTVEHLDGELLSIPIRGAAWNIPTRQGPRYGFRLHAEEFSLRDLLAPWPELARRIEGRGRIRAEGDAIGQVRGQIRVTVPRGTVGGLPLDGLDLLVHLRAHPADWGSARLRLGRAEAALAGGHIQAVGELHLGDRRDFRTTVQLSGVDVRVLSRAETSTHQGIPGRLAGLVTLAGPDVAQPEGYRGAVDLDLEDTALVDLPVLNRIDRYMGAARGGAFDAGHLDATIADGAVHVDRLILVGPAAHLFASGTLGFDLRLDLTVLAYTGGTGLSPGQSLGSDVRSLGESATLPAEVLSRASSVLSERLLKFHVSGTLFHPRVDHDPSLAVDEVAVRFFLGVLKLPLERLR